MNSNANELLCNTVILICSKMKSQNVLEQKQSNTKKIHPKKKNNNNFCPPPPKKKKKKT